MKKNIFIVGYCFFFLISSICGQPTGKDFSKLSWLEGTWIKADTNPGSSGNERWIKISDTELQGFGVEMKGSDTSFIEKLKIIVKDENIFYVADVPENKGVVLFRFTIITDASFTCENLQHDFPKKIVYEKNGNQLKAVISGDGKSIEYLFEKKQE